VALGGACVDGAFSLNPLQQGFLYLGPTQVNANSCRCSTVFYSVLSACAVCQNETYLDWSVYDMNCTTIYNETFLEPIPSTIVVPHYAYLDVKPSNSFNITEAANAGGPESSPLPSATSSTSAFVTFTPSTPTTVAATSKKLNLGAIVGGVVGGVAFVGIVGLITLMFLRRRRRPALTPSTYSAVGLPGSDGDMKFNSTIPTTMMPGKIYDPNDPSTYPYDPVSYSNYSGSPQRITPTITGNATLVGVPPTAHAQYSGVPEL